MKRPDDLGPITSAVLHVLGRHTRFPWPILKSSCDKLLLDPAQLDVDALSLCIDEVCDGLSRLTSPETAAQAKGELAVLVDSFSTRP